MKELTNEQFEEYIDLKARKILDEYGLENIKRELRISLAMELVPDMLGDETGRYSRGTPGRSRPPRECGRARWWGR